jgi:two-component sensor histidine kinase
MFRDIQSRVRSIARIHETLYSSEDLAEIEFGEYARVLVQDLFDMQQDLHADQTLDAAPGQLCVEDDGIGLPQEFNTERAESMGMYLVRILTRQVQGTLTWESRQGKSTRICVRFPISIEEAHLDL